MRGFRAAVALLVAGSAVAGAVAAVALTGSRASFDDVVIVLAVAAYAAVGTAVELARPGHLVGRLMLVGALAWGVGEGLLAWGLTALDQTPGSATAALLGVLGTAARGLRLVGARARAAAGVPGRPLPQPNGDASGGDGRDGLHRGVAGRPGPPGEPAGDRRQPDRVAGVVAGGGRPAGHRLAALSPSSPCWS